MHNQDIVLEYAFASPLGIVWEAITDPGRMRLWFFEQITSFKPEVGFSTRFDVAFEGKHFVHEWHITDVLPRRRIAYRWRYAGYAGDASVTWELTPGAGVTRLILRVEGLHTFPQDIPEFTRDSCIQGWQYFLGERLKGFLEKSANERRRSDTPDDTRELV